MSTPVKCVLLIDDDRATNFFNKRVVTKHDCFESVNTVQSGKEALEYLEAAEKKVVPKPDLIFLDINMPAMDGWEFLTEFTKLNSSTKEGIKVIMLTTSSNPNDLKESKRIEYVKDFINKPLSIHVLDDVLKKHFSNL